MENNQLNRPEMQDKDNKYWGESEKIFHAFSKPKTIVMVSKNTGISKMKIQRYIHKLLIQGKIIRVEFARCEVSNKKAWYFQSIGISLKPLNFYLS